MKKGMLLAVASVFCMLYLLSTTTVSAETVTINTSEEIGMGKGIEIGHLIDGFTCRISITNNDDQVEVKLYRVMEIFGRWEWDEEDLMATLGPGDSYTYWLNLTGTSTSRHLLEMEIVWESHYAAEDVENIEMDIEVDAWGPDGKEFPREDLLDRDLIWDIYLESLSSDDDSFPIVPVIGSTCCGLLFLIILVIVIIIIVKKKRSK